MSTDFFNIGPVPCAEDCAQLGKPDFDERSRRECTVYRRMLRRLFPAAEDLPVALVVKSFKHDFGTYREVCVRYDDTNEAAFSFALDAEANAPEYWDARARAELSWYEERDRYQQLVHDGRLNATAMPAQYLSHEPPADLVSAEVAVAA